MDALRFFAHIHSSKTHVSRALPSHVLSTILILTRTKMYPSEFPTAITISSTSSFPLWIEHGTNTRPSAHTSLLTDSYETAQGSPAVTNQYLRYRTSFLHILLQNQQHGLFLQQCSFFIFFFFFLKKMSTYRPHC